MILVTVINCVSIYPLCLSFIFVLVLFSFLYPTVYHAFDMIFYLHNNNKNN